MRITTDKTAEMAAVLLSLCSTAAANQAPCIRAQADQLSELASCGHEGSIRYCLSNLPRQWQLDTALVLQQCFINAGCTAAEAHIEAEWSMKRCEAITDDGKLGELRRRASKDASSTADADDSETTSSETSKKTTKTTEAATTTKTTSATSATSTSTTAATSTTATTSTNSRRADTSGTSGTTAATAAVTTTTATTTAATVATTNCSTTTTVSTTSCPIQSTGTGSGKETLSCFPTLAAYATCAAGMLCSTDTSGNAVCLKMKNSLDTAGVIITIAFSGAALTAVVGVCFCCCRERREHGRMAKAAEAAAIAKQAALDKKRPSAAVRNVSPAHNSNSDAQPLMAHRQPSPGPSATPSHGHGADSDITGPNPFTDQHSNLR